MSDGWEIMHIYSHGGWRGSAVSPASRSRLLQSIAFDKTTSLAGAGRRI